MGARAFDDAKPAHTMSTTTEPPESEAQTDEQQEVEKEVVITAYAAEEAFGDRRAFAAAIDPTDTDYWSQEEKQKTSRTISIGGEFEESPFSSTFKRVAKELVDAGVVDIPHDGGHYPDGDFDAEFLLAHPESGETVDVPVIVSQETTAEFEYVTSHTKYKPQRNLLDHLLDEELPDTLSGGLVWDGGDPYVNGDDVPMVTFDHAGLKERKLLAHRTVRSPNHRYESAVRRFSLQYTVSMGPAVPELIEAWSDEVVGKLTTLLGRLDAIEKVRITSCKVSREGDCFDIA